MPKTVVIWDSLDANLEFFVTDKDVARFDKKYVNSCDVSDDDSTAISNLMYNADGDRVIKTVKDFPIQAVRDDASVIVCGFFAVKSSPAGNSTTLRVDVDAEIRRCCTR